MKRLLSAAVLAVSASSLLAMGLLAVPLAAGAQSLAKPRAAKPAERASAIASIQGQLKAFDRDDYKTAVTYQSAGLRRSFGSPAEFRAMITQAYPEFAHFKSVTFGPAQCDPAGVHLALPATVVGKDGVTVHALYLLVREGKIYHVEGVGGGMRTLPQGDTPGTDV